MTTAITAVPGQNPLYQYSPVGAPFIFPGKSGVKRGQNSCSSPGCYYQGYGCHYNQAGIRDRPPILRVPCLLGTPMPSVIMTKKPICAAIPSLPHTRVMLPWLNGKFFKNVTQIRNGYATSTGQCSIKLLLRDLNSRSWHVTVRMLPRCSYMKGFSYWYISESSEQHIPQNAFGVTMCRVKGKKCTIFSSKNCKNMLVGG